ncbi:cell division protein ZapB [uncultured Endozoicomonas sp.]|uniref:cell division protein ZapB n=1 Tax=uncultured Endozoicomonas sp. TaxID=432652 RepID=UPI00261CB635|nr:cell division protein ZapB [uncultured Endozoicomonas sp.]
MSIESLGQLESRLQNLIDKLELSRMEVEDLRSANSRLEEENTQLKQELSAWADRVSALLGKLDVVSEEETSQEEEAVA